MPYTLMKGLAWVLLAVVLGIVIGWLLRSVAAKRQIDRARREHLEGDEHAELERLRSRVANLEPVVNERDRLRAELERARAAPDAEPDPPPRRPVTVPTVAPSAGAPAVTDVSGAAAVFGREITPDDLTVIEGIGPQIAELCHGIGIRTWAELSVTEVSLLRTMLNDAGQRFKAHDPSSWPEQAGLLAAGAWNEFVAFVAGLDSGRLVD